MAAEYVYLDVRQWNVPETLWAIALVAMLPPPKNPPALGPPKTSKLSISATSSSALLAQIDSSGLGFLEQAVTLAVHSQCGPFPASGGGMNMSRVTA